jgi:hypothetical protein
VAKRKNHYFEKRKPTYLLKDVKRLINKNKIICLKTVTETTNTMCLTISQAHEEILNLENKNFYKSIPDNCNPKVWQDVYKKEIKGFPVYIKFKIVDDMFLLMSFKPNKSK